MFLVESDQRRIASVRLEQLRRPFVPVSGLRTAEDAREFLCRFQQSGGDLRHTLASEMTQGGWGVPSSAMTDTDLITAAAREIASRRTQVVAVLPENPIIRFDDRASHDGSPNDIVFLNPAVASAFLAALRTDSQVIAAIDRALAHDSGSPWVRNGRALESASKALGADRIRDEVARLLAAGFLLLLPLDSARRVFRLVWRRPSMPRRSAAKLTGDAPRLASPPRIPPPPPPKLAPGPRSILPKPPSFNSLQAGALIAAAQRGTPFCEECARAAASQS